MIRKKTAVTIAALVVVALVAAALLHGRPFEHPQQTEPPGGIPKVSIYDAIGPLYG